MTANSHKRLVNFYGKAVLDASTVSRWGSRINGNLREKVKTDLIERFCSGRPAAVLNEEKAKQADNLIRAEKRNCFEKL